MKTSSKRIFTALISVMLACMMVFSVACEDQVLLTAEVYTVSVNYENGKPVTDSQIKVVFTGEDTTQTYSADLGTNGIAAVSYSELNSAISSATKTVTLTDCPTDYSYSGEYTVSAESRSVSITLKQQEYKVNVTYADNTPVTDSNIVVTFYNPAVSSESYQAALGKDGSASVSYSAVNAAVTSDTKNITLYGYSESYRLASTYTVSSSSRTATVVLQKQEDYTVVVNGTDGQPLKNSNTLVTFYDPEDRSSSYATALGATGTLSVDYAYLNTVIPSANKLVSLSNYGDSKYYDANLILNDTTRTATFEIKDYSFYTVTVKYDSGALLQETTGMYLQFTDQSNPVQTYQAQLSETGITSFYADEFEKSLNLNAPVTVSIVGLSANYLASVDDNTLSKTKKSATITLVPYGSVEGHFEEYFRAQTNTAVTIDSWLLGLANRFIFPANNQAVAARYNVRGVLTVYFASGTTSDYTIVARDHYIRFTDDNPVVADRVSTRINVYKTTVHDQNYNPVKDVCLRMTYIENYNYIRVDAGISSAAGTVVFYALHDANRTYQIRLEDFSIDANVPVGYLRQLPTGYSNPDVEGVMTDGIVTIEPESYNKSYPVYYSANNYYMSQNRYSYEYARYIYGEASDTHRLGAGAELDEVQENNTNLALMLEGGIYSYFTFQPYLEPGEGPDGVNADGSLKPDDVRQALVDERQAKATEVASGRYRISLSTTDPTARLYYYASTLRQDVNGVPVDIGGATGYGGEAYFTGTDYIELNLRVYNNESRISYAFGVVSNNDCRATIIVERLGDSIEPADPEVRNITPQVNLTQYENQVETVINDMPINGSFTAIYVESEDRYHINTVDGPILHVALTRNMTRVFNESGVTLANLPERNDFGEAIYYFTEMDETGDHPVVRYDYVDFVAQYAAVANDQGLYPVTGEMQQFLAMLANKGVGLETFNAAEGCGWYTYCQYYGILDAVGAGTQDNPYSLLDGESYVTLTGGTAYATIRLTQGVNILSSSTLTISYTGDLKSYTTVDIELDGETEVGRTNLTYITVTELAAEVTLVLTGTDGRHSLNAGMASTIENVAQGEGVDEGSAIRVLPGVYNISSKSSSGYSEEEGMDCSYLYIDLKVLTEFERGEYRVTVFGMGVLAYNGSNYDDGDSFTLTLDESSATHNYVVIHSVDENGELEDANFMLVIERVVSE